MITTLLRSRAAKWTLGLLGTILVGAIGSGVWQGILGPVLHGAGIGLLNLVSLGFRTYKDSVYQQVAVDNPSVGVIESLSLLTTIVFFAAGFITGTQLHLWGYLRGKKSKPANGLSGAPTPSPNEPKASPESANRLHYLIYTSLVGTGVLLILCLVNFVRTSYINSAVLNYHQTLRVVSPYLNPQERSIIESQFAQIGTRQNYVDILDELRKIAQEHHQKVPQFEAW